LVIVGNPKESGADLAVALVNTWDTFMAPYERLATLDDLRTFLERVGRPEAARAARKRDLDEVREVRERLRRVFDTDDLGEVARVLNELAADVEAVPRLEDVGGAWKVRFGPAERSVAAHLGATAAAALIDIVQAHGLTRFGTCSGPPCTGAFVDSTKNRSKRYCCQWCADREAQRRHRARST
jgi:predicted RNA-binding Zn ribbon-like protein